MTRLATPVEPIFKNSRCSILREKAMQSSPARKHNGWSMADDLGKCTGCLAAII